MKCILCQKESWKKTRGIIEQDGIEVEAHRCSACGEEIMTMCQLKALANKYRKSIAHKVEVLEAMDKIASKSRLTKDDVDELARKIKIETFEELDKK